MMSIRTSRGDAILQKLGAIVRGNLVHNALRNIYSLMPYGYGLVKVKTDKGMLKLYTHFEGVQVIDEVFCLREYWKAFERNPRTIVDLGAHIGTFTLLAAHFILNTHRDGLVVSVEPMLINYLALLNNIKLNNVEKYVYPIRAAVASKPGLVEVEWIGKRERVRAMTMQEIADEARLSGIDLVKMDIEGAELDVLTNNKDWLRNVNSIVMELHPQVYGLKGLRRIIEGLREEGFDVKVIRRNIDTGLALEEWVESVAPSPTWLIITLWKALVATFVRNYEKEYWLAMR